MEEHLNTSHVIFYPRSTEMPRSAEMHLNTSHVIFYLEAQYAATIEHIKFKYISCYLLSALRYRAGEIFDI